MANIPNISMLLSQHVKCYSSKILSKHCHCLSVVPVGKHPQTFFVKESSCHELYSLLIQSETVQIRMLSTKMYNMIVSCVLNEVHILKYDIILALTYIGWMDVIKDYWQWCCSLMMLLILTITTLRHIV